MHSDRSGGLLTGFKERLKNSVRGDGPVEIIKLQVFDA
jgi:hypothetical protein